MDNRLLLMLSYLLALRGDLIDDDKKTLKSLLEDFHEVYAQYDYDPTPGSVGAIISYYNSLVREYCSNNRANAVLVKTVERLLADKSKGN